MPDPVRVRFAPSPTGDLHVGGARTALFNWLFARRHGGKFILRIEDTDKERNTSQALADIFDGLRWLGLDWDEGPESGGDFGPYFQSQRNDIYARHLARLRDSGAAYEDENGVVRLRSPKKKIVVLDQVCGPTEVDRAPENDTALQRSDGSYIFHFVNVVDDLEMKITHVIRGGDHLYNTAKHLEIIDALGASPPLFAHIPLILKEDGSKLSKRDEGGSLKKSYLDAGFLPEAVRNYLCLLGWSPKDDREVLAIDDVISLFDWDHVNRSNAKFDMKKCLWLNSQYLAALGDDDFFRRARDLIGAKSLAPNEEKLRQALLLMKPKIKHLPEIFEHLSRIFDAECPLDPDIRDKLAKNPESSGHLHAVAENFEALPGWTEDAISASLDKTAEDLAIKKGKLMFPLRVAVTGSNQGTDLLPTLALIGKGDVVNRLRQRIPLIFKAEPNPS